MNPFALHDPIEIEGFLRTDPYLNLYSLGDLDPFFWPYTKWYGRKVAGRLTAVCLLYFGFTPPVFHALATQEQHAEYGSLLEDIAPLLPRQIYAHLSPGLDDIFRGSSTCIPFGEHQKMALNDWQAIEMANTKLVSPLTSQDMRVLLQLYKLSYPHHAFDARMLLTDQYFGVWEAERLISVAGVHVFSEQYRVAALGNITTHPNYRGQGLAAASTAQLCKVIRKSVDHIGLNVKSENQRALDLYQRLGFKSVAKYHEWVIEM